jgi:hypothetical protein
MVRPTRISGMDDQDDDFWITYIASTPGQDADFAPAGKWLAWIVAGAIAIAAAIFLFR